MDAKEPRKPTPREVELSVLDKSRRRCALCFHLKGDLSEKNGQIAHLDDNRANAEEDNLAFLCLEHHSLYDSKTSQHKGYTVGEAKEARRRLYETVEQGMQLSNSRIAPLWVDADRQTFYALMEILPSNRSIGYMRNFSFGNCFQWEFLRDLTNCRHERGGPEHEFLNPELEAHRTNLLNNISTFESLLAHNSFRLKDNIEEAWYKVPDEWAYQNPQRWHQAVDSINDAAEAVTTAYDTLVRECRRKLLI